MIDGHLPQAARARSMLQAGPLLACCMCPHLLNVFNHTACRQVQACAGAALRTATATTFMYSGLTAAAPMPATTIPAGPPAPAVPRDQPQRSREGRGAGLPERPRCCGLPGGDNCSSAGSAGRHCCWQHYLPWQQISNIAVAASAPVTDCNGLVAPQEHRRAAVLADKQLRAMCNGVSWLLDTFDRVVGS